MYGEEARFFWCEGDRKIAVTLIERLSCPISGEEPKNTLFRIVPPKEKREGVPAND